jgi:hypothetical protein
MTPEERKLVIDLFDRLATLEDAQRDPEAERLIRDGLRQAPNAPYALVQTVLVQDEALKRADARIRELEGAAADTEPRDTSFLGGMRESLFGKREGRGSVPSVRAAEAAPTSTPMSPAWHTGTPAPQPMPAEPGGPAGAPMGSGGSFLGTAAAAAAGVIGGSMLLSGIRSMMGTPHGAHAAFDPAAGASGSSPWGGGDRGELSREAGLDDIGRGRSSADDSASRRHGALDDSGSADDQDDPGADDLDDGGFGDDGGGDEE